MNNLSFFSNHKSIILLDDKMKTSVKGGGWGNGGSSNGNGCPPPFNPGVTPGNGNQ